MDGEKALATVQRVLGALHGAVIGARNRGVIDNGLARQMSNELRDIGDALKASEKHKIRIVIDFASGIIQDIDCDQPGVELDIAVLGDEKDEQYEEQEIFRVESGDYKDRFIQSHYGVEGDSNLKKDFDAVFAAAKKRVDASYLEGKDPK